MTASIGTVVMGWDGIGEYTSGLEGVPEMVAVRQSGTSYSLSAWLRDGSEDEWIAEAQDIADECGEAVACVQGGRLIVLLNPSK